MDEKFVVLKDKKGILYIFKQIAKIFYKIFYNIEYYDDKFNNRLFFIRF
jgi:hypothetical protein